MLNTRGSSDFVQSSVFILQLSTWILKEKMSTYFKGHKLFIAGC